MNWMLRMRRSWVAGVALLMAAPAVAQAQQALTNDPALYCEGLALPENYGEMVGLGLISAGQGNYLFGSERDLYDLKPYPPTAFHFLRRLSEALRARGTTLVMALTPPRGVVLHDYMDPENPAHAAFDPDLLRATYDNNVAMLREAGIIAPNLLDAVMADPAQRGAIYFFDDFHWAPIGARLSAEAIAEEIRAHSDYGRLTPYSFTLESEGMRPTYGPYSEAVDAVCGIRPPSMPYEFFATAEQASTAEASSSDLLLDEPAEASSDLLFGAAEENIVLVGTSFSRRKWNDANFPGMLAHYAGAFVDNRAVAGGALEVTMDGYLRSRDFRDQPPPFLVWELAAYYSIDGAPEFFRSIIPAAFGECAVGDALATGEGELVDGAATVISVRDGGGVPAERSFLFMEVDDLSLVEFTLEIEDATGFVDRVEIDRSTRVMNDGRFFMEFLDLGAPVVEVRIAYEGEQRGGVSGRVCQEPTEVARLY